MREALGAIQDGTSVRKASTMYGIPRTTLNDYKLGKTSPGAKQGAPMFLSTSEETDLVAFLIESADIVYGRTRQEVLAIVSRMLARKGVKREVSRGFWTRFLSRHPILTIRSPSTLSVARARASTRECIQLF